MEPPAEGGRRSPGDTTPARIASAPPSPATSPRSAPLRDLAARPRLRRPRRRTAPRPARRGSPTRTTAAPCTRGGAAAGAASRPTAPGWSRVPRPTGSAPSRSPSRDRSPGSGTSSRSGSLPTVQCGSSLTPTSRRGLPAWPAASASRSRSPGCSRRLATVSRSTHLVRSASHDVPSRGSVGPLGLGEHVGVGPVAVVGAHDRLDDAQRARHHTRLLVRLAQGGATGSSSPSIAPPGTLQVPP